MKVKASWSTSLQKIMMFVQGLMEVLTPGIQLLWMELNTLFTFFHVESCIMAARISSVME